MIGGASRWRSCVVAVPIITLQGSFLRVLPCIQMRSSSLSAMPIAMRVAGEQSGSLRVLALAACRG